MDNNYNDIIESLTISSNIHKKVRQFLIPYIKPNIKLIDIANIIENKTIELSKEYNTINHGIGFPCCLSLNNCVAHYHPSKYDKSTFTYKDVLKIDIGTEVNGWITDSAFTITFNKKYSQLLNATKESNYNGIKTAGIDVRINEWGENIQEIMESYELEHNGNTYPIKIIKNLNGHNILKNNVHGGIILAPYKTDKDLGKFTEGIYAIEPFGVVSFDKYKQNYDYVFEEGEPNLYKINSKYKNNYNLKSLYDKFNTIPFTDRYLNNNIDYNNLIKNNLIKSYSPLYVPDNCYSCQYEHCLYIGDNKKICFSYDYDY